MASVEPGGLGSIRARPRLSECRRNPAGAGIAIVEDAVRECYLYNG